jgi:peptidyl-prolyl cis-trans isomerase A (cyclophilin A)
LPRWRCCISFCWRDRPIPDDPVVEHNDRAVLTFASAGPNTRTTQLFFNLKDNRFLDGMKFAPIAKVPAPAEAAGGGGRRSHFFSGGPGHAQCVRGCDVLDRINMQHGETPNQGLIQSQGNGYLQQVR